MRKRKTFFEQSLGMNNATDVQYLRRLTELSVAMFEWKNLPDTVDPRFLELVLFTDGQAVFFYDEVMGYLCLQVAINGGFDVYRIPLRRRAYAVNGYQRNLDKSNSVIIWNNLIHTNSILDVRMFAERLYNLDRIVDVNANAQKTPVLLLSNEKQRLTMLNLYKEVDGNAPVIFGDSNLDIANIKAINTGAPFIADKIYDLKVNIWNEALTYLGISNLTYEKKERVINAEIARAQGGTIASRYSRLQARKQACEEINKLFGLELDVEYRSDFYVTDDGSEYSTETEGAGNE